jgi:surfeit locus 1 family protein
MLSVLIGLGTWQVHRLAWKQGVLAAIDHAEAAAPVPLPAGLPDQFIKIRIAGVWERRFALYGAEVRDTPAGPQMGGQLLQLLDCANAPPVLIDRGWVAEDEAAARVATGAGAVDGFVRRGEHPGWLSATDDPVRRRFYTLDPAAIGAALGAERVAPFTVVALGPAGTLPAPARSLPRPPNDHLSYAITWYGLALVLLVVFTIWSRKVLRP